MHAENMNPSNAAKIKLGRNKNTSRFLSQWGGGFPRHVRVSGLGQEAHAAAGSPAAPVHASHHAVWGAVLGGQLIGGESGPDQEASPYQSAGE